MRRFPLFMRMLLKASRVGVPCLLLLASAAVAHAEPQSPRASSRRRLSVCDPRTTSMRRVMGHRASLGPVANRPAGAQAGLIDTTAQLRRATRTKLDQNEDAAIQNDAPAARIDFADRATPVLRPIGVLCNSFDRLPATLAYLPRSPRGPPSFV